MKLPLIALVIFVISKRLPPQVARLVGAHTESGFGGAMTGAAMHGARTANKLAATAAVGATIGARVTVASAGKIAKTYQAARAAESATGGTMTRRLLAGAIGGAKSAVVETLKSPFEALRGAARTSAQLLRSRNLVWDYIENPKNKVIAAVRDTAKDVAAITLGSGVPAYTAGKAIGENLKAKVEQIKTGISGVKSWINREEIAGKAAIAAAVSAAQAELEAEQAETSYRDAVASHQDAMQTVANAEAKETQARKAQQALMEKATDAKFAPSIAAIADASLAADLAAQERSMAQEIATAASEYLKDAISMRDNARAAATVAQDEAEKAMIGALKWTAMPPLENQPEIGGVIDGANEISAGPAIAVAPEQTTATAPLSAEEKTQREVQPRAAWVRAETREAIALAKAQIAPAQNPAARADLEKRNPNK